MYPIPASRRRERRDAGDVAPVEHDPARGGVPHPHDRLDQLRLAVALDPGDAEHLARVHDEVHVRQQRAAGRAVQREALDAQHLPVRDRGLPRARVGSSLPTIISASSRLVTVRGSAVPTLVPRRITVMLSAIARTSSSLWEMNRNV